MVCVLGVVGAGFATATYTCRCRWENGDPPKVTVLCSAESSDRLEYPILRSLMCWTPHIVTVGNISHQIALLS